MQMKKSEKLKLTVALIGLIFFIVMIPIVFNVHKSREKKLKANPCYTDCESVKLKKSSKAGLVLEYIYYVENKRYEGSYSYNRRVDKKTKYDYRVRYVCDEPNISELVPLFERDY